MTNMKCIFPNEKISSPGTAPFFAAGCRYGLRQPLQFNERFEVLEDRLLPEAAGDATEEQRLTILIDVLAQNFEPLLQQGSLNIADYRGSEQKILLISLLYYLYRRYQQRFDQYIQ